MKVKIIEQFSENKAFALWSYPKSEVLNGLVHQEFSDGKHQFVLAPFDEFMSETQVLKSDSIFELELDDLEQIKARVELKTHQKITKKSTIFDDYKSDFEQFMTELKSESNIQKLILAQSKIIETEKHPLAVFSALHQHFRDEFCYIFYDGSSAFWYAASPEILIKKQAKTLQTMALAGTQVAEVESELNWTKKEFDEHQFVVDYIGQTFDNLDIKAKIEPKPKNSKAGFVWHLKTEIEAENDDYSCLDIAKALHPSPAICGTPKKEAKAFILNKEQLNRSYYCGYVGYLSEAESQLFVNLRCANQVSNQVEIFAGGGLTVDSELESEWQESQNKSKTIAAFL
ncbi:MAG: chorismate-binding protein [Flavobacteriales bacterium]